MSKTKTTPKTEAPKTTTDTNKVDHVGTRPKKPRK